MSTNKWAVLVSSSDYWFNYRHMTSVMALYGLLTRQGFTHSNILLLNALEAACSPLNPSPGCVYTNASKNSDKTMENFVAEAMAYLLYHQTTQDRLESDIPQ